MIIKFSKIDYVSAKYTILSTSVERMDCSVKNRYGIYICELCWLGVPHVNALPEVLVELHSPIHHIITLLNVVARTATVNARAIVAINKYKFP